MVLHFHGRWVWPADPLLDVWHHWCLPKMIAAVLCPWCNNMTRYCEPGDQSSWTWNIHDKVLPEALSDPVQICPMSYFHDRWLQDPFHWLSTQISSSHFECRTKHINFGQHNFIKLVIVPQKTSATCEVVHPVSCRNTVDLWHFLQWR